MKRGFMRHALHIPRITGVPRSTPQGIKVSMIKTENV